MGPDIDVGRIMERIRESVRQYGQVETPTTPEKHVSPFEEGEAAVDFGYLHSGYDTRNVDFVFRRAILAPFVGVAKRAVRKLITPILQQQVSYNAASTRVITHIKDWIGTLQRDQLGEIRAVKQQMEALGRSQDQLESQLREEVVATESRLGRALAARSQEILDTQDARLRDILADQARLAEELARILHALKTGRPQDGRRGTKAGEDKAAPPVPALEPEFDYWGFEDRFRGSEAELTERQRTYVQCFEGRKNILDIGCGRGEFLELLRDSRIEARGVDLNREMVLRSRDKGLDVVMADAFAYLGTLPDDSLGGVFAGQVIEHLHPSRVVELVKLCHRKLEPGAPLILETPNPKCLMVFADTFYKDPSHTQPMHPETLQFLFEATGFHEVEVRFLAPVDPAAKVPLLQASAVNIESFNQGIERLNGLLFGFQDYAVIGRKGRASACPIEP